MSHSRASRIRAANAALIVNQNVDAIGDFFSPDYVVHPTDRDVRADLCDTRTFINAILTAFSEIEVAVEFLVEVEDRVAWQRTWRGTHRSAFMGFPATGRRVVWRDVVVSRFQHGMIAEDWSITDLAERLLSGRKRETPAQPAS